MNAKSGDADNDETRRALSDAEQRYESLAKRAGIIAHDFNNLLSSILGYAELLIEQIPDGDPRLDDVKQIRRAGERAAALSRQLRALSKQQALEPGGATESSTAAAVPQAGSETVLVVEDDEPVRDLAGRVLRRCGYQVLMAASAAEAEAVFAQHSGQIDLLLTDVVMPQTTGIELATRLTALKPTLLVVYMSGYTQDGFANRGPLDPKVTLINKPFTPELLAARMRQVLDQR